MVFRTLLLVGIFITATSGTTRRPCDVPVSVPNGQLVYEPDYDYEDDLAGDSNKSKPGDLISIVCDYGFELVGEGNGDSTCTPNGSWDPPIHSCSPKARSRSDLGTVTCSLGSYHAGEGSVPISQYQPGEKVFLACHLGYYFDRVLQTSDYMHDESSDGPTYVYDRDPQELTCQSDGRWDKSVPTCHAFSCQRPSSPRHGAIRPKWQTLFRANETIRYVCGPGTVLIGYSSAECDMEWNGWNTPTPKCMTVRCPRPVAPKNGWMTNDKQGTSVGSTVHYYCNRGYERYGSPNQTCLPIGKWSNITPICRPINLPQDSCANPPLSPGLSVRYSGNDNGAQIEYRCHDPEYLRGAARQTCGPLGWTPTSEPECEALHAFDDNDDLVRAISSIVDRFSSSADDNKLNHHVSRRYDLYMLIDSSGSVPPEHFELAKSFVETLIDMLTLTPSGTSIGLLSFSTSAKDDFVTGGGTHANPRNTTSMLAERLRNLKYIGKDTNITGALEFAREVMIPVTSSYRGGQDVPKVIFLFTDGDYTIGGNPGASASLLKRLGVEIFTVEIGTAKSVKTRAMMEAVSSNEYFPRHYPHFLKIKDKATLDYLVKEVKARPKEIRPFYGLAGDVDLTNSYQIGGEEANATSWPWVVTIQGTQVDWDDYMCTGTLISDQWVLTAGKCVQNNNNHLVVKSASSPLTFDMAIVEQSYASGRLPSDVALLKLSQPMTTGPYVTPVRLPDSFDELDDKFGDFAVTIGWNVTTGVPRLIQAAIPIVQDRNCGGSAPSAGYCAGLNTAIDGPCQPDLGSPLMIRTRPDRDRREVSWVQIGVAWQSDGCTATHGNSARFNRLERHLQWIRSTMQL